MVPVKISSKHKRELQGGTNVEGKHVSNIGYMSLLHCLNEH
jgi:hypothetical protein